MNEETQMFEKQSDKVEKPEKDRHSDSVGSISIRAWLALALIGSVVTRSVITGIIVGIYVKSGKVAPAEAIDLLKITEPLYTMASMALAYYFGQQQQRHQNPPAQVITK